MCSLHIFLIVFIIHCNSRCSSNKDFSYAYSSEENVGNECDNNINKEVISNSNPQRPEDRGDSSSDQNESETKLIKEEIKFVGDSNGLDDDSRDMGKYIALIYTLYAIKDPLIMFTTGLYTVGVI